jgi:hypothetical protein
LGLIVDHGEIIIRRPPGVGEQGELMVRAEPGVEPEGVEIIRAGTVERRAVGDDEALAHVDVLAPRRDREEMTAWDRPFDIEIVEEQLMPIEGAIFWGQINAELVRNLARDFDVPCR